MTIPKDHSRETQEAEQKAVASSFRYRFVTQRNLAVLAAVGVVLLIVMFVPW